MNELRNIKKSNFLDKKWHNRIRKIEKASNKKLFNFNDPKLCIDTQNKSFYIVYGSKNKKVNFQKINRKLHKRKVSLSKLYADISIKEHNKLIKDYYIQRIKESKLRIDLWQTQYLENQGKNQKVNKIQEKFEPEIPEKYTETFINEFILFLNYLKNNKEFDVNKIDNLKDVLDHSFYKTKDLKLKIEFGEVSNKYNGFRKKYSRESNEKFSPKQIKRIIKNFLSNIGLSEEVKVSLKDKYTFSADPRNRVLVPKSKHLSKTRLMQVMVHEICVHIYRGIMGKKNKNYEGKKLSFLAKGMNINSHIEEGVASYFEQNLFYDSSKYDIFLLYNFYLRIIAVHLAKHFDPYTVYEKLEPLCLVKALVDGESETYAQRLREEVILRIYRHYEHPEKGCVNPHPAVYLYGNRLIWEFIENGGNINNLFAGKISIAQIDEIKKLGFNVPDEIFGSKEYPRDYLLQLIAKSFS